MIKNPSIILHFEVNIFSRTILLRFLCNEKRKKCEKVTKRHRKKRKVKSLRNVIAVAVSLDKY